MQISKRKHGSVMDGWIRRDGGGRKQGAGAIETDLHSAFDQIEGNHSCVRGATAQNPTKAAQDEILLRAELTTVSL